MTIWTVFYTVIGHCYLVQGQLQVISPPGTRALYESGPLKAPDGLIPVSTSTFGAPTYGESFVATVVRFPPDASNYCDGANAYGEDNFAKQKFKSIHPDTSIAFLIDRGGCSFMEKAYQAEKYGADAVIFIDSRSSEWDRKTLQDVIVADNGHGLHVNIPSVIMTYEDGHGLIAAAQTPDNHIIGPSLVVEFNWEIPQGGVIRFDFWMSSGMENATSFLSEFSPMAMSLGDKLHVVPHFYVVGVKDLDKASRDLMCYESNANYCVPCRPHENAGSSVINEDIRQLCLITNGAHTTVKAEHLWMEYVAKIHKSCPEIEDRSCGDSVLHELGGFALQKAVHQCMSDEKTVLRLLDREKNSKAWAPLAMRINEARYSGNLDASLVMKTICSGYAREHRPEACNTFTSPGIPPTSGGGSMLVYSVVFIIIMIVFRAWYKNDQELRRQDLRASVLAEVKSSMSGYQSATEIETNLNPCGETGTVEMRKIV